MSTDHMSKETVRYDQLPDAILVRMSCNGDTRAYETLVTRYRRWVIGIAYAALLGTSGDARQNAEDIAQDVFVNVYRRLAKPLRAPDNFRAYVARATQNAARSARRTEASRARAGFEVDPEADVDDLVLRDMMAPQDRFARREDTRALLADALARLRPDLREALLMRFSSDPLTPFKDIAQALGIEVNAAEKRVTRALNALNDYFERTGRGRLLKDVLRSNILVASVGAEFVEHTMARVRDLPPPNLSTAGFGGRWLPYVAGAMSAVTVLVVGVAELGARASDLAGGGFAEPLLPATVVTGRNAPRSPASVIPPASTPRLLLNPQTGADGWVAADPTSDGTRPTTQDTHPYGRHSSLMTLNSSTVHTEFDEPANGRVVVSMWIQPPLGAAGLRVGLMIGGETHPLNALGVYIERDEDGQWSIPRQDIPTDGRAPAFYRDRERRTVASYEYGKHDLRFEHDTRTGYFDVWLDGVRVAYDVPRPWTANLPVTGVYIGGGRVHTAEGQATYFGDVTGTLVDAPTARRRSAIAWQAAAPGPLPWGKRSPHNLREAFTAALGKGDLPAAADLAAGLRALLGPTPEVDAADRRLLEAVTAADRVRPASVANLARLRRAVSAIDDEDRPSHTTDVAFGDWLAGNPAVMRVEWNPWWAEYVGGKHLGVRFRPEDYVDRGHLFAMATEVVRAYHFMNASYAGCVSVLVLPHDGGAEALVSANSRNLGEAFHGRYSPGGQSPPPPDRVAGFVHVSDGTTYANTQSALLVTDDWGNTWRRADSSDNRVEALFASGGMLYGRKYGAEGLVARTWTGHWRPVRPAPQDAVIADAFLRRLSMPHIDPRIGLSNEADNRKDVVDVLRLADRAFGIAGGVVTLRDAVYPIPAWRVVVTPNTLNFPSAEAAFAERYTERIVDTDWLWDNLGVREAALATTDPPGQLPWRDVAADAGGWVDLETQLRPTAANGLTTGYMVCYLDSPDARRVALNVMRTGALGVWVNGTRIPDAWRQDDEGHDNTYSIPLSPGRNALMIKMGRLGSDWGVGARFLPDGMEGIRVAAARRGAGIPIEPVRDDVWVHVNHLLGARQVHALHVSSGRLYAGTQEDVWAFSEESLRWTRQARGVEDGPNITYGLTTHHGVLYSARTNGVYRLDPVTETWESRSEGLTDRHVRAVVSAGPVLLAGTYQGHIYKSDDDGRHWTRVRGGPPARRM